MNPVLAVQALLVVLLATGVAPHELGTPQPAALTLGPLNPVVAGTLPPQSGSTTDRTQEHAGGWTVGWQGPACYSSLPDPCCGGEVHLLPLLGIEGVHYSSFRVNPATRGLPFLAAFSAQVSLVEPAFVTFFNDQGRLIEAARAGMMPLGSMGSVQGTVPDAAAMGYMFSCTTGRMDARYHAGAFDEVQTTTLGGKFGRAVRDPCPGWGHVGADVPRTFHWTAPNSLSDGTPAQTTRVEVHFTSPIVVDAELHIRDAQGNTVARGTDSLMWKGSIEGEFTIWVWGCGLVAGPYAVHVFADLAARPAV